MVAVHKPSAECDSVCLVVKFLRIDIIKRFQFWFFKDLCVKSCNTIHCISEVDINVCHVHSVHVINNVDSLVVEISSHSSVQIADNRHQLWNHFLQITDRPFFKRFRKNRVICICTWLAYNIHSRINIKVLLLCQDTDKLRYHHCRMCIIDLDAYMFVQMIEIYASVLRFFYDELCRIAHHKILLI